MGELKGLPSGLGSGLPLGVTPLLDAADDRRRMSIGDGAFLRAMLSSAEVTFCPHLFPPGESGRGMLDDEGEKPREVMDRRPGRGDDDGEMGGEAPGDPPRDPDRDPPPFDAGRRRPKSPEDDEARGSPHSLPSGRPSTSA